MDYIDSVAYNRHAGHRTDRSGQGLTLCGRTIRVQASGACIASMIDCESCRRKLRKEGWDI